MKYGEEILQNLLKMLNKGVVQINKTYYDIKIALKKRILPAVHRRFYKEFGDKSIIDNPLLVRNKKLICIGNNVIIKSGSRIEVVEEYMDTKYTPILKIGDNVCIEFNFHISCVNKIIIEDNVLIAGNVTIIDNNHGYNNTKVPIMKQELIAGGEVRIGSGSFIGMGARIMPGVKIGENCVVGANSVITKDVPDFSIVAGVPGKVIKKFDLNKMEWIRNV